MSNSVVGVTREMLQPVDEAIELLKSGNIRAAMDHLQLIDKTRSEELFTRELMALSEGVALVRQNRFDEAAPHLVVAENLIGLIGLGDTKTILTLAHQLASGYQRLFQGDSHGAASCFDNATAILRDLSFFHPELQLFAYGAQAAGYVALANAAMSQGDLIEAEKYSGKIKETYRKVRDVIDENGVTDPRLFTSNTVRSSDERKTGHR